MLSWIAFSVEAALRSSFKLFHDNAIILQSTKWVWIIEAEQGLASHTEFRKACLNSLQDSVKVIITITLYIHIYFLLLLPDTESDE